MAPNSHAVIQAPEAAGRPVLRAALAATVFQTGYALLPDAWLANHCFPLVYARPAAWLVAASTGLTPAVHGAMLDGAHARLAIVRGCDGSDVLCALLALTAASPVAWKKKLRGALLGCLLVYALNVPRLALLYWLAERAPAAFPAAHEWLFPALIASVVGISWWRWTLRHATRCTASAATTQGSQRPPASNTPSSSNQGNSGCS